MNAPCSQWDLRTVKRSIPSTFLSPCILSLVPWRWLWRKGQEVKWNQEVSLVPPPLLLHRSCLTSHRPRAFKLRVITALFINRSDFLWKLFGQKQVNIWLEFQEKAWKRWKWLLMWKVKHDGRTWPVDWDTAPGSVVGLDSDAATLCPTGITAPNTRPTRFGSTTQKATGSVT